MESMSLEEFLERYPNKKYRVRKDRLPTGGTRSGRRKAGHSTDWEARLQQQIDRHQLPAPIREYQFHPGRQWRADFAWPADGLRVLCEVEGGVWINGRHNRGQGFINDCEKYNTAALRGWTVIRVVPEMIEDGRAIKYLKQALVIEGE